MLSTFSSHNPPTLFCTSAVACSSADSAQLQQSHGRHRFQFRLWCGWCWWFRADQHRAHDRTVTDPTAYPSARLSAWRVDAPGAYAAHAIDARVGRHTWRSDAAVPCKCGPCVPRRGRTGGQSAGCNRRRCSHRARSRRKLDENPRPECEDAARKEEEETLCGAGEAARDQQLGSPRPASTPCNCNGLGCRTDADRTQGPSGCNRTNARGGTASLVTLAKPTQPRPNSCTARPPTPTQHASGSKVPCRSAQLPANRRGSACCTWKSATKPDQSPGRKRYTARIYTRGQGGRATPGGHRCHHHEFISSRRRR